MKEEPPIEPLLEQIRTIIEYAKDSANLPLSGKVDPKENIPTRIENLRIMIEGLGKIVDKDLEAKNISPQDLAQIVVKDKKNLPVKTKKELEKMLSLGKSAMSLKYALIASRWGEDPNMTKEEKEKEALKQAEAAKRAAIIKRKSTFKKMGGGDTWKKL